MNIYGLLATLIIASAVVGSVALISFFGIKINITRNTNTVTDPKSTVTAQSTSTENLEKDLNDADTIAKASMDAVIQAANELMGIQTEAVNEQAE